MAFGLFKKRKKDSTTRYQTLKIKEVVNIAKDAVNLVFEKPDNSFEYQPGQFITIVDSVDGKKIRRAYSLYSTPFLNENPAVTVKRVPGGSMSNHINDHYQAGMDIEIMEPMGMFTTTYHPEKSRNVIMFGGGSGITPLFSLIRSMLHEEPQSMITLVYGNRTVEHIIFKEQLDEIQQTFNGRFSVVHILDEDHAGRAEYVGVPDKEMMQDILLKIGAGNSHEYYICGPQPMMDLVMSSLESLKVDNEKITIESFDAKKANLDLDESLEETGQSEVTIILDGVEHNFQVPKEEHILENGLKKDIDMPYSCQSGLCTACRGKVLEGEVDTSKAEGLTQSELDEGYALMCVGKPVSDKITVEIG